MNTHHGSKKTISLTSTGQRLATLGYEWHSSEYFISPDEVFPPDTGSILTTGNCIRCKCKKTITDGHLNNIKIYS